MLVLKSKARTAISPTVREVASRTADKLFRFELVAKVFSRVELVELRQADTTSFC
jgi:hypothetical protein